MTETQRPTQEEREHALEYAERAAFKTWANGDERRLARVTLALAADDAKAAGEPEQTPDNTIETCGTVQQHNERVAQRGECVHCGGDQLIEEAPFDEEDARLSGQGRPTDDRASRRLAYVREKAPVILAGMLADTEVFYVDPARTQAIEQAGLIFDETEQSE